MNDRYDAGYGGDQDNQYELVGYDEYGRPVYQQAAPRQAPQQPYDPYGQQQGYGYDPYATGRQQPPAYDPYGTGRQPYAPSYDPYGAGAAQP
ncbi:LytR family transcriptional regulator, partial [Streptomyces griseorubiginosus]|nr:LytR family transcriptional regulator [Streptomyces griseorubiginosus]